MAAAAQPEGGRWRGLALTTVAVLGLHLMILVELPRQLVIATSKVSQVLLVRAERVAPPPSSEPATAVRTDPAKSDGKDATDAAGSESATPARELAPERTAAEPEVKGTTPDSVAATASGKSAAEDASDAASPPPVPVVGLPGTGSLRYKTSGSSRGRLWHAIATLVWQHDGMTYVARYRLDQSPTGSRIQVSTGAIGPEGFAPERYSERVRTELAVHFDRQKQRITFSADKPAVRLLPGAQDRLSLLLQLQALFAGEPSLLRRGTKVQIQTASTLEAEVLTFEVIGRESVLGMGDEPAAVLVRKASTREYDPTLEFWFLESSPFTLVRFRASQANGDFTDHVLLQEVDF